MQPEPPFTPGLEAAGRVVAAGAAVENLEVGDLVAFSVTAADGGLAASTGSWAHHCMVKADLAMRLPANLDPVSAAAVPVAYLTAHRALFTAAQMRPSDTVLVRGASGAVGLAAVHLARHFGMPDRLIVGTSSKSGITAVEQRGAFAVGHGEAEVRQALGELPGFDVILDLMANDNLGSDLSLVAPGGRIAVIGSRPGAGPASVDARQALVKEASVRGVFLWKQTKAERARAYRDIFQAFKGKDSTPPSVRRFSFREAQKAHDCVALQAQGKGQTEGKVVLVNDNMSCASAVTASPAGKRQKITGNVQPAARIAAVRAAASAQVIDVHAHAVLEEALGAAGPYGPEVGESAEGQPWFRIGEYHLRGVKYRGSPFMDVSARIALMDKYGIDLQVLSPNPLTYFHHIPADQAAKFCRMHNDAMARLVAKHPDRLAGFAALPMQNPELAAQELKRSVQELGLLGGYIGTDFGIHLDDPSLDPFYALCSELDVPLFMHPAPQGIDGPPGDPRLRRYEMEIVIGFNLESSVAISTLIFGGVLDRHPKLDVCFPSGGGAVACLLGRMAAAAAAPRPWVAEELRGPGTVRNRLRRLWFDTHMHCDSTLRLLREHCGDDRLVFGTNFAGWDQEQGENPPNVAEIDVAGNARRLLRLDR
eukprot:TRINITY_DN72619_c0_g1_i1.p1 TRINITY_DN72619_c0_g1~~TRINITY_DN72619_c0_g1_i1.p1  ORF type:complete len:751 (-),score=158.15 TRINITY_DN72619_c0_g1_i1:179-2128(-)